MDKSKLKYGLIPENTVCPFTDKCGYFKDVACNGNGCPASTGDNKVDFSCGAARLFDMLEKRENIGK